MATDRGSARGREGNARGRLRGAVFVFRSGAIFFAVLGVLILGAILKDETPGEPGPPPASVRGGGAPEPVGPRFDPTPAPPIGLPRAAIGPAELEERPAADVEARALADRERIQRTGGGFTLQLAAVCDRDNATRWLDQAATEPDLYLLPATIQGRACYRICFGHFPRAADAVPSRVPRALRESVSGSPRAVPIGQVLPP